MINTYLAPPPVQVVEQGHTCPDCQWLGPLPSPLFKSARIAVTPDNTLVAFSFLGDRQTDTQENPLIRKWAKRLFNASDPIPVGLYGTAFQRSVWTYLLHIRAGTTRSYGELATAIGRPGASRAVGAALGANPIGWLVPCHRVVRSNGELGGYAGGIDRKKILLDAESSHNRLEQV